MSASKLILRMVGAQGQPVSIAQINAHMADGHDYAPSVYGLANAGKLRKVGSTRPALYTVADAANDAKPAPLPQTTHHESDGTPKDDTTFAGTVSAITPSKSGRVWFQTNTALRLVALALSQPGSLADADRALISEAIHATSDQL